MHSNCKVWIDLMHWRHKGSHLHNNDASLVSRSAHVLCWQCALALSLSVRGARAGQPGGVACRVCPPGCMLGDGASGSVSIEPQRSWAPFCDVICIWSIWGFVKSQKVWNQIKIWTLTSPFITMSSSLFQHISQFAITLSLSLHSVPHPFCWASSSALVTSCSLTSFSWSSSRAASLAWRHSSSFVSSRSVMVSKSMICSSSMVHVVFSMLMFWADFFLIIIASILIQCRNYMYLNILYCTFKKSSTHSRAMLDHYIN